MSDGDRFKAWWEKTRAANPSIDSYDVMLACWEAWRAGQGLTAWEAVLPVPNDMFAQLADGSVIRLAPGAEANMPVDPKSYEPPP